jgi:hypothetical protein
MYPCIHCGEVSYRSLGTLSYCWAHFWRELIPRRRRQVLIDLCLPDDPQKIGHFVFDHWVTEDTTKEAWVKCSLCECRTVRDVWHSLGYPCGACVERFGAARRMILLPPPSVGGTAATLERWSSELRKAVESGDITTEEAFKAWASYESPDE